MEKGQRDAVERMWVWRRRRSHPFPLFVSL